MTDNNNLLGKVHTENLKNTQKIVKKCTNAFGWMHCFAYKVLDDKTDSTVTATLHCIYKGRGHKLSGFFVCSFFALRECGEDFLVKSVGGKAHGSKYSFSGLVSSEMTKTSKECCPVGVDA